MNDRLTADPGTLEFYQQLLEIAQESDHPMDKALAKVLSKEIGETRANEQNSGVQDGDTDQPRRRAGRV